jgi:hypothetical protein
MTAGLLRTAAAGLAAAAAVLLVVGVVGAVAARPHPGDLAGPVLSDYDRRALAADPARRGADPVPTDPAVAPTDPAAVARAYLVAAHSLVPADAGRTQRRATGYALPGSPAAVGVVVLDPPPPGAVRTAVVTGLDLAGATAERRGYRAALRTETARPGGPVTVTHQQTLVVLARSPDGRWRVVAETLGDHGIPIGED